MKKLRRRGIADLETANAFLETDYWADHNRRFAQAPAGADDFHVARPRGLRLDTVFRLEETRTVSNDWVVRYANRYLQLERQSGQAPARSTVVVCESRTGALRFGIAVAPCAGPRSSPVARPRVPRSPRRSPSRHRRSPHANRARTRIIRGGKASSRWAVIGPIGSWWIVNRAHGSCRSRGRPERAHRSLENQRTVFHELPQASSGRSVGGDISNELTMGTFLTSVGKSS